MRRPSPKLFELIKSLNKAEILNFRAYASRRKGEKQYLALFDALLEMEELDEEQLKEKLELEGLATAHLYKTKNYLYKIILDSLVGTNQEDEYELYTQIQKIIILILKSLYTHAEELFPEAHRIAAEQENFEAILILLGEERNLIKARAMQVESSERLKEIRTAEMETAEKSYNLLQYNHLLDQANAVFHYQGEERDRQVRDIAKNPLMHGERQFRSTSSRILYWLIKARLDLSNQAYELSRIGLENAAILYEQHPELLKGASSFRNYLDLLKNLMMVQLVTGKLEMAWAVGEKLKTMASESEKGRFLILERYFYGMLAYMDHTLDQAFGLNLIGEYRAFYAEFSGRIDKLSAGINDFLIAKFLVSLDSSDEALFFIYRVLNQKGDEMKPETILFTRILQLIAFFDSGQFKYLNQAVRSGREFMKGKKIESESIKMVFSLFQQIGNIEGSPAKTKAIIADFEQEWEKRKSEPPFAKIDSIVRISLWLKRVHKK